jgi:hypothetical protein
MKRSLLIGSMLVIFAGVALLIFLRRSKGLPANYVCTPFKHVKIRGRIPAFTPNGKYQWAQGKVILVYFDEGVTPVTNKIITIANEWHQFCNISFKITPYLFSAMVKVSFQPKGYGSAVGMECIQPEYKTDPSMYLEGMDTLRDQVVFRRVVLHEFGHALGLEHELSNPNAAIKWDSAQVYDFYKTHNHWDTATVNEQIFKRLDPSAKEYSDFDSNSIMIYAVAPPLIKGAAIPWPRALSDSDKKYINIWYPRNYKTNQH